MTSTGQGNATAAHRRLRDALLRPSTWREPCNCPAGRFILRALTQVSGMQQRLQKLRGLIDKLEPELMLWDSGQGRREETLRAALAVSQELQAIINTLRSAKN
jgi:ABC-type phosphonate transport system ATPase subunit